MAGAQPATRLRGAGVGRWPPAQAVALLSQWRSPFRERFAGIMREAPRNGRRCRGGAGPGAHARVPGGEVEDLILGSMRALEAARGHGLGAVRAGARVCGRAGGHAAARGRPPQGARADVEPGGRSDV